MNNYVADDILLNKENSVAHYGIKRRSGRYPWGSGGDPYQHEEDFYNDVNKKMKEGFTYTDEAGNKYTGQKAIAEWLGYSTSEYRTYYRIAKNEVRNQKYNLAVQYEKEGLSRPEIAKRLGLPGESSVRSLLNEGAAKRMNTAQVTAELLKKQIEEKGMIDVSKGTDALLGVSSAKLDEALTILAAEGYYVHGIGVKQVTNDKQQTNIMVAAKPGTTQSDLYSAAKEGGIKPIQDFVSYDGGDTFKKAFRKPTSISSDRLLVKFDDDPDSGTSKDGLIEIRRGVEDLYLGDGCNYAQVRILVDDHKYLKGMCAYSDNIPDGYDIVFNSNKPSLGGKLGALKDVKTIEVGEGKGNLALNEKGKLIKVGEGKGNLVMNDDNPFGSLIKEHGGQSDYIDKDGNEKLSPINKRAEEGDWQDWSHKLPPQFLVKQDLSLIKKQIKLSIDEKMDEYDEIMNLTNPTVKKKMLYDFANNCDSEAVDMKTVGLPGTQFQVILPMKTLGKGEAYAPNYENGSRIALIRFPHGGQFEIPILTVNNKNKEGKGLMGTTPKDAVGISKETADILSGADFDGDTVMVIPLSDKVKIKNMEALPGLKDFDPKVKYPGYSGMKVMSDTQKQMGVISNLITDMTLAGADLDELAAAVRHSMTVIDAEKHKLNYKQSEIDNNIAALHKKYQGRIEDGRYTEGAATIISRAKGEKTVRRRVGSPHIDPETGELVYKEDPNTWIETKVNKRTGEVTEVEKFRTQKSTQMAEAKDAYDLVSTRRDAKELAYAEYANKLKALGNEARKAYLSTGLLKYDPEAAKEYANEVDSMKAELLQIRKNKPRERQAQLLATAAVNKILSRSSETVKDSERKKIATQELAKARARTGAKRTTITITDRRWEAIQKGAIHDSVLREILQYSDLDSLRSRATPRTTTKATTTQINRMKSMAASGYTTDQIAQKLHLSTSTISKYLRGQA